jgi:hypothetical protein
MSTHPLKFKRSEVSRAIRAVEDTGWTVDRVLIRRNGEIEVYPSATPMPAVPVIEESAA